MLPRLSLLSHVHTRHVVGSVYFTRIQQVSVSYRLSVKVLQNKETIHFVYLSNRSLLLHYNYSLIFDKHRSNLCTDSQYHSVHQLAKYKSSGNAITMTSQTFAKCTQVRTSAKYTSCVKIVTNTHSIPSKMHNIDQMPNWQSLERGLSGNTAWFFYQSQLRDPHFYNECCVLRLGNYCRSFALKLTTVAGTSLAFTK